MKKLIVLVVFVLIIWWFLLFAKNKNINNNQNHEVNNIWNSESFDDSATWETDKVNSNLNIESLIRDNNLEGCTKLADKKSINYCKDSINMRLALENRDFKYCDAIKSSISRVACRKKLDEYFLSRNDCEKIRDISVKNKCSLNSAIDNGENIKKEDCLNVIDINDKTKCLNYYYYNSAIKNVNNTDLNSCNSITNTIYKQNCIAFINKRIQDNSKKTEITSILNNSVNSKNKEVVDVCKVSTNLQELNICLKKEYTKLAVKTKTISYCNNLPNSDLIKSCKSEFVWMSDLEIFKQAKNDKNPALCDKLSDSLSISQCKQIVWWK